MSEWQPEVPEPLDPLSAYLSLIDSNLLLRQFENRHLRGRELTLEQRKAWAQEMAVVMAALAKELQRRLPMPYSTSADKVPWNAQMRAGQRPVTYKTDGKPYSFDPRRT